MGIIKDVQQVGVVGALRRSRLSMAWVGMQELGRMARSPKLYFSDIKPHPSKTAVIVVDMINGFLGKDARLFMKNAKEIIPRSNRVIDAARKEEIPIFYLCDAHTQKDEELKNWPFHCPSKTWESQVHPQISQPVRRSEWKFKTAFSAFQTTDLDEVLRKLGTENLIILGVATEYCDEANSSDGIDHGYKVWVVSDSIREVDLKPGDGDRAVYRMLKKGVKFLDTAKAVEKLSGKGYQMPFSVPPTNFPIGPSVPENARPLVTEVMVGSQKQFTESLNYRRDPLPAWLTQTDWYQLTMANFFHQVCRGTTPIAHFEVFIRKLPEDRNFMIFSGLHDILYWLKNAKLDKERIDFILKQPILKDSKSDLNSFRDYLENFRFNLDVWSNPEGTFYVPFTPYMGISGPLEKVLMAETYVLSTLNSRSGFSTRAAQFRLANPEIKEIDMGMRRMDVVLSEILFWEAWKQGFISTSNTEAAFQFGFTPAGSNSHAAVSAFKLEIDFIRSWMDIYENYPMVLADTYNTLINALKTVMVLQEKGLSSTSFRVDNKALIGLMSLYEKILRANGFNTNMRVGTSDLTPLLVAEMAEQKCLANVVGLGTKLGEVPATPGVLKLSEIDGQDGSRFICKLSLEGKGNLPGIHQVWREFDTNTRAIGDTVALLDEKIGSFSR